MYSSYYQAHVVRKKVWFVIGLLRNEDGLAFPRTYDPKNNIIELFVSPWYEEKVTDLLSYLQEEGSVISFEKKENRLMNGESL
jgi:hypothetical protein